MYACIHECKVKRLSRSLRGPTNSGATAAADKTLEQKMTISEPRRPEPRSAVPANKPLNKKVTISKPRQAGARSAAAANKPLKKKMATSEPRQPEPRSAAPANKALRKESDDFRARTAQGQIGCGR